MPPSPVIDERCRRALEAPLVAHLATLTPAGAPRVEPIWYILDGNHLLITTDERTTKAANIRRDQRVALSMTMPDRPLDHIVMRGRVVESRTDEDLEFLDALSVRYTGKPHPRRRWSKRVVYVIEPTAVRCTMADRP